MRVHARQPLTPGPVSVADVDECELGTHNCPAGAVCHNTEGSFRCQARERCLEGFLQDPEGNCVDINECTSLSEPCRSGFNCINTVGSYTCRRSLVICGRGYHASEDGTKCVDVNECETGVHRCGEGQACHNLPGSYRCDCKPGFQRDAFGRACIDVNECWTSPTRVCQHTCENTLGSYRCSCASGFLLAADGKHCEDVNECEAQRCSQECANIYGSYQCYCRHGYQLAEDGHTCTDIDECTQGVGVLCTFHCINVPGSYQCACPEPGYTITANGRSCKGECGVRAGGASGSPRVGAGSLSQPAARPEPQHREMRAHTVPRLPGVPERARAHHALPPQLPDRAAGACTHLPHQPRARLRRRHHRADHHQGQRGGLLRHAPPQRLHGRGLPAARRARAARLRAGRGDEALAAGLRHHLPGQDAHLLHHLCPVRRRPPWAAKAPYFYSFVNSRGMCLMAQW
uniref:EGF-like domain-containing protein n=1 Tax=Capra hircus TaxID=9925 RepID=A0A452F2L1_CAPHI